MAVCAEYRVPHGYFLGGPFRWTQLDRDKAIWWHVRQKQTCSQCGTREEEWDPELGGDRQAYGAEYRRCRGCEVKAMAEDALTSDFGRGIYISMRKNDRVK
jgi:hypothetical protein